VGYRWVFTTFGLCYALDGGEMCVGRGGEGKSFFFGVEGFSLGSSISWIAQFEILTCFLFHRRGLKI